MDVGPCIKGDRLQIAVKPNARKSAVLKVENDVVHLAIAAPPEDGKANAEVERFLSKLLGGKATIKTGFANKRKTVQIRK